MIRTENLTRIFRTEEVETIALNGVNIEVEDGEFIAIMGPSGCGKSTLLNILGLLDSPTEGKYWLNNEEVGHLKERERTAYRKGRIGFVFQSYNLFEVQKYLSFTEHALVLSWSIFNTDFWNGLSETDRAYLTEKFTQEAQMSIDQVNAYTKETFSKLESEYGMTVITEENGLDKQAFIDNAAKFYEENFTDSQYDGWWEFRNAAMEWCAANPVD